MPSRDLRGLRNHHIASFHQVNYFKATVIGCIINCICNFQFPAWMASPGWPSSSVILALQRKMHHSLSVPQVQIDLPYFEENDQPGFHSRFAHPSLFWTRWCSTPLRTLPLCFQVIFEYSTFISHDYIGQKVRVFFKVLEKVTTTSTLNLPQRSWRMTKSRVECLLMHGDLLHNQIFSNNGPHILSVFMQKLNILSEFSTSCSHWMLFSVDEDPVKCGDSLLDIFEKLVLLQKLQFVTFSFWNTWQINANFTPTFSRPTQNLMHSVVQPFTAFCTRKSLNRGKLKMLSCLSEHT